MYRASKELKGQGGGGGESIKLRKKEGRKEEVSSEEGEEVVRVVRVGGSIPSSFYFYSSPWERLRASCVTRGAAI